MIPFILVELQRYAIALTDALDENKKAPTGAF